MKDFIGVNITVFSGAVFVIKIIQHVSVFTIWTWLLMPILLAYPMLNYELPRLAHDVKRDGRNSHRVD